MAMTVVVVSNVSSRIKGFLASTMLEVAPGVYSASRLNPSVRDRVWDVISDWFSSDIGGSVVMLWDHPKAIGGQAIRVLGLPRVELVEIDGLVVSHR